MEATIGVEFMYINIKDIDKDDPSKTLSIQIWDTSGAERYKAITINHIRGADGVGLNPIHSFSRKALMSAITASPFLRPSS